MIKRENKSKSEILRELGQSFKGEETVTANEIYHASTNSLEVIHPVALVKITDNKKKLLSEEEIFCKIREQRRKGKKDTGYE